MRVECCREPAIAVRATQGCRVAAGKVGQVKIRTLKICNYRSLECVELSFASSYSTISGKNNAGKSSVFRIIHALFGGDVTRARYYARPSLISSQNDYPYWKRDRAKEEPIDVTCDVEVFRDQDSGLTQFIERFLKRPVDGSSFTVSLRKTVSGEEDGSLEIQVAGQPLDKFDAEAVQEKLAGSTVIFHDSPQHRSARYSYADSFFSFLSDLSVDERNEIGALNKQVRSKLRRLAKRQEEEIGRLLGRLEDKYEVAITLPDLRLDYMPFEIALSDRSVEVGLDDWGSGTRNRTLILLSILRARQLSQVQDSPSGISPIVLIEEPECYLHHSAQAEFGRVLRDLAAELDVQVIVTTHSPYMLNLEDSAANILLQRRILRGKPKETQVTDTEGDQWMSPFAEALGVAAEELGPLRSLFFSGHKKILLVEGTTDKEYLELLRSPEHGEQRLVLDGEIFPYGGKDVLKNTVLLRFIKERHDLCLLTFDADALSHVAKSIESLGFERDKTYFPIGQDGVGKDCVEGLLPDAVRTGVLQEHPDLANRLIYTDGKDKRSAKEEFKRLCLQKFKKVAKPGTSDYGEFYKLSRKLNRSLRANLGLQLTGSARS